MDECIDNMRNTARGYANVPVNGRDVGMHRVVYCRHNNVSLDDIHGLVVRHRCDNARCINPLHLEIGTQSDNAKDMHIRGGARVKPSPGESNGNSKLSISDVENIRKEYAAGEISQTKLGKKYNIKHAQVSRIVRYLNWK